MRDDHLSHPECKSKNVPQQSCMGFSYKGNGLIRAVGRAGVGTPLGLGLGLGLGSGFGLGFGLGFVHTLAN